MFESFNELVMIYYTIQRNSVLALANFSRKMKWFSSMGKFFQGKNNSLVPLTGYGHVRHHGVGGGTCSKSGRGFKVNLMNICARNVIFNTSQGDGVLGHFRLE